MDSWTSFLTALCAAAILVIHNGDAIIVMKGCTEGWVHLSCPGDDKLNGVEVEFTHGNSTEDCDINPPAITKLLVPTELTHLCTTSTDCTYDELVCGGKSECAFYMSPHFVNNKKRPNVLSEVIVKYECDPGVRRQVEVGIIGVIGTIIFALVIFLIISIIKNSGPSNGPESNYNQFDNVLSRPGSSRQEAAGYDAPVTTDPIDLTPQSSSTT